MEKKLQRLLLETAMTVGELREILSNFDDEQPVLIARRRCTLCHTRQVQLIQCVDEIEYGEHIEASPYSATGFAIQETETDDPIPCEADVLPIIITLS